MPSKETAKRMSFVNRVKLIVPIMHVMFPDGIYQREGGNNGDVTKQLLNAYNLKYEDEHATHGIINATMAYMVDNGIAEAKKTPTSYKWFKLVEKEEEPEAKKDDSIPVVNLEPLVKMMEGFIKQADKANKAEMEQISLIWSKVNDIQSKLDALLADLSVQPGTPQK